MAKEQKKCPSKTRALMCVSKENENHPEFLSLAAVYGLGSFCSAIPESETKSWSDVSVKEQEQMLKPVGKMRDLQKIIGLKRHWGYFLDCEEFSSNHGCVPMEDVCLLTQSSRLPLTDDCQVYLHTLHYGFMKQLCLVYHPKILDTKTNVVVTLQSNGTLTCDIDQKAIQLFPLKALIQVVNEMNECQDSEQVWQKCVQVFPSEIPKQLGLFLSLALNNLSFKIVNHQVVFF